MIEPLNIVIGGKELVLIPIVVHDESLHHATPSLPSSPSVTHIAPPLTNISLAILQLLPLLENHQNLLLRHLSITYHPLSLTLLFSLYSKTTTQHSLSFFCLDLVLIIVLSIRFMVVKHLSNLFDTSIDLFGFLNFYQFFFVTSPFICAEFVPKHYFIQRIYEEMVFFNM